MGHGVTRVDTLPHYSQGETVPTSIYIPRISSQTVNLQDLFVNEHNNVVDISEWYTVRETIDEMEFIQ